MSAAHREMPPVIKLSVTAVAKEGPFIYMVEPLPWKTEGKSNLRPGEQEEEA